MWYKKENKAVTNGKGYDGRDGSGNKREKLSYHFYETFD